MTIEQTRVLLVGGTSGIGFAIAQAAAARGATPVLASKSPSRIDSAVARIAGAEGSPVDVADEASVSALLDTRGPFDHVVFTAGGPLRLVALADLTSDTVQTFLQTRLLGALAVARAAAPRLRPGGSITFTSGTAAERPGAGWAMGAAVCGAINALTQALAVELAPVRVNAVAPGVVRSPLWSGLSEQDRAALYDSIAATVPLQRVGEVDDVALAYLYLMEQAHSTGVVLTVDGGTVLA